MGGSDRQNILVVDDEQEILELISGFINGSFPGAVVTMVGNGVEAYERCRECQFELICTDQRMPYLTGTEFVNAIRKDPNGVNRDTPVIFVSAYIEDLKNELVSQQNIFYLAKPFSSGNLELVVDQIMVANTMNLIEQNFELKQQQKRITEEQGELIHTAKMASYNEFSVSLAHELNNPLAVIEGVAYLLSNNQNPEKVKPYALQILKNVGRMKKLVAHLQRFSSVIDGDFSEKVNLAGIVRDSFMFFHERLRKIKVKTNQNVTDESLCIKGNEGLLTRVFHSLILNSIEAFERNPHIEGKSISVSYHVCVKQNLLISYLDNAGGIPQKLRDKIFDPFTSSKKEGSGVGLGLSVAYGILTKMGGNIRFSSKEGGGANFVISFPLEKVVERDREILADIPKPEGGNTGPALNHNGEKRKMLIVDDELGICELLESYCSEFFDVEFSTNPLLVPEMVREKRYDVIVTDFKMPQQDGMSLINQLVSIQTDLVFILISGHLQDIKGMNFVGNEKQLGFISKPFGSPAFILSYVNEMLASSDCP